MAQFVLTLVHGMLRACFVRMACFVLSLIGAVQHFSLKGGTVFASGTVFAWCSLTLVIVSAHLHWCSAAINLIGAVQHFI